jgi:hypothetical protein
MADGHLSKCKECQKSATKAARDANPDYYKAYDKGRANDPKRVQARKDYARTDAGLAATSAAKARYIVNNPLKRAAHILVRNALRAGKLVQSKVYEACDGTHKIEGHHDNYLEPLVVRWLCEACHKQWHRDNKAVYA